MNKEEILKNYSKEEDRLLISKMLDQITLCNKRNKIQKTDFLDERQSNILQKVLKQLKVINYELYGGFEQAERKIILFYPEKWNREIYEKNKDNELQIIEIILPNELKEKYVHRDYLGGLMKLGIKREKIGDIVVWKDGAHIIIQNEVANFLKENLKSLTRFQKANIEIKDISDLHETNIKKEEIEIMVSSMRLDNIVSEICRTSRTKAEEIINSQRAILNYETVMKTSKEIKPNDKLTIRGKGKFEIKDIVGNTKKGRYIVKIEQYVS